MLARILKQQKLLAATIFVFTLSVGALIGTLATTGVYAAKGQTAAPDATPLVVPVAQNNETDFTRLAKMAEPSVVNITTDYTAPKTSSKQRQRAMPQQDEEEGGGGDEGLEMFRRFFRDMPGGAPGAGGGARRAPREATGSGFIVDKNGYIITNNHVVEKAEGIKVKFPGDKMEYKARVIGTDWESDIAVIKIDVKKPLAVLKIGNSDGVQVGDWAVAIGSPFGLAATVTAGIVSATGRDVSGAEAFQRFIQTDAAINPGNSGGPLLNIKGEVIGINTAIATQTGGYQGIGFALPVNVMARVYNNIIQYGRVRRGSIGIGWSKMEKPEILKAAGVNGGVLVENVTEHGPAAKAGVKPEDVITALNGKAIKDGDDLIARVSETPIGQSLKVTVDREGKKLDLNVTVEDREEVFKDDPRFASRRKDLPTIGSAPDGTPAKFGIAIRPLSDKEKKDASSEGRGVYVTTVQEASFAEEIGLRERDIIVSINRQPVASPDDLRRLQGNLKPGDAVAFRVMRPTGGPVLPGQKASGDKTNYGSLYVAGTLPGN